MDQTLSCKRHAKAARPSCTEKSVPMRASCRSNLPMLLVPHESLEKELSNECIESDLRKEKHLLDGNDAPIEAIRNDDNLRRRTRSEVSRVSGWSN